MNRRDPRLLNSRRMYYVIGLFAAMGMRSLPVPAQTVVAHQPADDTRGADEVLARLITVHLEHVSLVHALNSISRTAKIVVQYQEEIVKGHSQAVSIDAVEMPIGLVLERLLSGTQLRVVLAGEGDLAIVPVDRGVKDSVPATGVVSGRVVDSASGAGLHGAVVRIAGTKLSAMTTDSGRFTIRGVPAGDRTMTAKLFGYRTAERVVPVTDGQATSVRLVLTHVTTMLSGVVTTATGVQRKIEVGSDITTLNVDSISKIAPITSVTDLLEARVPGLTVVHSSGAPGDPARLRLRGAGSIQLNNDPIMIVDGIRVYASQSDPRNQNLANSSFNAPSPVDQLDPNNIETIEVFKGPSATAIYGSDAANGVIVVTTKHGREGPTHWDLALGAGINWLPGNWPTNYYRFGSSTTHSTPTCWWNDVTCTIDSIVSFQALNDSRYTVFDKGNDQTASATVSGGDQRLLYSLTGSGTNTLGNLKLPEVMQARYDSLYGSIPHYLVRPDNYKTWAVGGRVETHPSPTLMVTVDSRLNNGVKQQSSLKDAINQLQGVYISPIFGQFTQGNYATTAPLIRAPYLRATDKELSTTNAMNIHWQPRPWLPLDGIAGVNTVERTDESYVPYGVYNGNEPSGSDTTGVYGLGRGTTQDQTGRVITGIPVFNERATLGLGLDFHSGSASQFSVATNQLAPGVKVPTQFKVACSNGSGLCDSPTSQNTVSQSTYGWYVEPRLNMSSRFFLTPGFRFDGGSGGSKSTVNGGSLGGLSAFPKMSFSYLAVDRPDQPLWGFLTQLRPRTSFGFAGTQPSPEDKLRLYNVGSYTLTSPGQGNLTQSSAGCSATVSLDGEAPVPAVCLNAIGNTQLRPERSSELEGGFDVALWQNRLTMFYTRYNKTRHDAIISVPVPSSVYGDGYSIQKNIGVVRNTGTEITLSATPIESRLVGWTVNGTFSNNNSLVVRLNKGQNPIILSSAEPGTAETRVQAGYPLDAIFARPIIGYADANGNGVIDLGEVRVGDSTIYVGQPNPKYQWNLSNDIALFGGRLGVHTLFSYQNGMTQTNNGACTSQALLQLPNSPTATLATQAAVVAAACNGLNGGSYLTGIGFIQRVNTFRFDALSVNFDAPRGVAQWFRVPRLGVAIQGNNLGLHSNYSGLDPNVNAFSTVKAGDQTIDQGQYPEPRTWWLRITMGN